MAPKRRGRRAEANAEDPSSGAPASPSQSQVDKLTAAAKDFHSVGKAVGREVVSTWRPRAMRYSGQTCHKSFELLQGEAPGDSNVAEVLVSQQGSRRRAREAPSGTS